LKRVFIADFMLIFAKVIADGFTGDHIISAGMKLTM
jgi:hypothetical protein